MTSSREPYVPVLSAAAKRAISDKLSPDVASGAVGIYSARLMRDRRVLYEIRDEQDREVHILDIRHRADAYRRR